MRTAIEGRGVSGQKASQAHTRAFIQVLRDRAGGTDAPTAPYTSPPMTDQIPEVWKVLPTIILNKATR